MVVKLSLKSTRCQVKLYITILHVIEILQYKSLKSRMIKTTINPVPYYIMMTTADIMQRVNSNSPNTVKMILKAVNREGPTIAICILNIQIKETKIITISCCIIPSLNHSKVCDLDVIKSGALHER